MSRFCAIILILCCTCFAFTEEGGSADVLAAQGYTYLKESDSDPDKAVDAAVALAAALAKYEAAENWDQANQVRAALFWTKKRMNVDQIDSYLAKKGQGLNASAVRAAVAKVEEVASAPVEKSQADEWFQRAKDFAARNTNDHFGIAIRYFEVAERFSGTKASVEAQKLSLDAQQRHMKVVNQAIKDDRASLFTRGAKVGKGDIGVPSASDLKAPQRQLKSLYKSELRERDSGKLTVFARKLVDQANTAKDDITMRYALLEMAKEMGQKAGACDVVWDVCDLLEADFAIEDPAATRLKAFSSMRRSSAAKAIAILLNDPLDPEANLDAGIWFCFTAERWQEGTEMLLLSEDEAWRKVAEMEQAKPENASERFQVGRAWDVLGEEQRNKELAFGASKRAYQWYKKSVNGLTGINKETATRRIAAIEPTIPLLNPNWETLTASEWDRIPGKVFVVLAKKANDPRISLPAGKSLRIVPHPEDEWFHTTYSGDKAVTWKGESSYTFEQGEVPYGGLYVQLDNGAKVQPGVFTGPFKKMRLGKHNYRYGSRGGKGEIRVKFVEVDN